MNQELYARIIRGILHAEPSTEEREPSRTYEMIERLKQAVYLDDSLHQKVLNENENCVEYWMNVKISCPFDRRFLLQVSRASNRNHIAKEQILEANHDYFIAISNNRNTVVRFYVLENTECRSAPTSGDERDKGVQRSSSFLRRWVRAHGRTHSCAAQRIVDMTLGDTIVKHVDSLEDTSIAITLKRRLISGKDFDPIMNDELLELIRCLYKDQIDAENQEDEVSLDLTRSIVRRIARFYAIPLTQIRLLCVGVALEQELIHSKFEITSEMITKNYNKLKTASLVKDPMAVNAAIYLSEQIVQYVSKMVKRQSGSLYLPANSESSTVFFAFCHYLTPVLDMCNLNVWEKAEVAHIKDRIKDICQKSIEKAVFQWLRVFDERAEDADYICLKVDEMHLCLKRFAKNYDSFFEKAFFKYSEFVVTLIDAHVFEKIQELINRMTEDLDPRNKQKLVSFTKSTMKLFDALRQFVEYFSAFLQGRYLLQDFESIFEKPAVFWTSTWRIVYLNFVKRSVDSSDDNNGRGPSSPTIEERPPLFAFNAVVKAKDLEMHPATVNTIAFCNALCEDFLRLNVQNPTTMLLCTLQIVNTLADCLKAFAVLLRNQLQMEPTLGKMIRAANGIEYSSNYILKHYERFLNIGKLYQDMPEKDLSKIQTGVSRIMTNAVQHCQEMVDEVIDCIVVNKANCIKKHTETVAGNHENQKRNFKFYMKQVFENSSKTDQIYLNVEKCTTVLKPRLLPRPFAHLQQKMWVEIRDSLFRLLLNGQTPDYYETIEKECELLCSLLNIDWKCENSALRRKIHANKLETRDLILQYYSRLADLTMGSPIKDGIPRICVRTGHLPLPNQMIRLLVQVICAYDVPILDSITQSSDPYLRIELYPRAFFPFSMFPPDTTDTKKKTLNPKWDTVFQMEIPEEYFFTNGSCLSLTVLDHDQLSYNDLAGQAVVPLSTIPRVNSLNPKHLPAPTILPLSLPQPAQYTEVFKILEERSYHDPMAYEVTYYEKYIRDYRILPPNAMDDKECVIHNRLTLAKNRQKLKHAIHSFIKR